MTFGLNYSILCQHCAQSLQVAAVAVPWEKLMLIQFEESAAEWKGKKNKKNKGSVKKQVYVDVKQINMRESPVNCELNTVGDG